jgi:hypothetical protein
VMRFSQRLVALVSSVMVTNGAPDEVTRDA